MTEVRSPLNAVVLAGERAGGNALARAEHVAASVLVEVAGECLIERVIATLRATTQVAGGIVVGPEHAIATSAKACVRLFAAGDYRWQAPASGPSASALAAVRALGRYPVLITAGDHALLRAATVDRFCAAATDLTHDFVVGLVPWEVVRAAYPGTRRTLLSFSDGTFCGANLFCVRGPRGSGVLELWQRIESRRKRPWRMASRLGAATLLRYLCGTLSLERALACVSALAGCRIGHVLIDDARAAIDVDSSADLALAARILTNG